MSGGELLAELRRILGDMAKDFTVSVEGDMVTIEPNPIAGANSTEAARLHERAESARSGQFEKAVGIYQRILGLDPTRQDSSKSARKMSSLSSTVLLSTVDGVLPSIVARLQIPALWIFPDPTSKMMSGREQK